MFFYGSISLAKGYPLVCSTYFCVHGKYESSRVFQLRCTLEANLLATSRCMPLFWSPCTACEMFLVCMKKQALAAACCAASERAAAAAAVILAACSLDRANLQQSLL